MKRLPGLRELSDDHHTGLVLARSCKRAAQPDSELSPGEAWEEVRQAFSSRLEPHFQIEEQHLLPALEAIGEAALAERIRAEHAALRDLRQPVPATRASLQRFGELLDAHIRYEERQVFEPTQHRLPQEALQAIAAACHAVRYAAARPEER